MAPPPASQFSGIFISYRRDDSAGHAGRLFDKLAGHFGQERIFMDIDTIEPGEDFVTVIENAVESCEILLAVIGRDWHSVPGETTRRLDNPLDFVRLEIAAALKRDIRVIPVLVQRASMPTPQDLPDELVRFTRRNAIELSDLRWQSDVDRLISVMEKVFAQREEAARLAEATKREEAERQHQIEAEKRSQLEAQEASRRRAEELRAHEEAEERRQTEQEAERRRLEAAKEDERHRLAKEEPARVEKERLRQDAEQVERQRSAGNLHATSEAKPTEPESSADNVGVADSVTKPPEGDMLSNLNETASLPQQEGERKTLVVNIACIILLAGSVLMWIVNLESSVEARALPLVAALMTLAAAVIVLKTEVPSPAERARLFAILACVPVLVANTLLFLNSLRLTVPLQLWLFLAFINIFIVTVVVLVRSSSVPPTSIQRTVPVIVIGLLFFWSYAIFLPPLMMLVILVALVIAAFAFAWKTNAPPMIKLAASLTLVACVAAVQAADFRRQKEPYSYPGRNTNSSPAEPTTSASTAAAESASRGNNLYAEGKYAEAEPHLRDAVRLQPDNPEYVNKLGDTLFYQKKYSEAEPKYREAVRLKSESSTYNFNLAITLALQLKYAEAQPFYIQAIRLRPDHALYQDLLGDNSYNLRKYDEAEVYYRAAVRLEPGKAEYVNDLGDALYVQGKYSEAATQYREAVRLDPTNTDYQSDLKRIPSPSPES